LANCAICDSAERFEIENALLCIGQTDFHTLDQIAEAFEVEVGDLQKHALFHSPIAIDVVSGEEEQIPSIAKQLKLREADMLATVAADYLVTLKAVGRSIQTMALEDEFSFARKLTKPLVDLYVGTGGELRATLKTLVELKIQMDGPKNDPNSGIALLFSSLSRAIQNDKLG